MNRYSHKITLGFFLMAVLFLLVGCKDLWHPQDNSSSSNTKSNTKTYTAATALEFASAVSSINNADRGDHTITVTGSFTADPVSFFSSYEKTITIKGDTSNRTISLGSNGSLITVDYGVTLTLGNNVTLQGRNNNTATLVTVSGTLIMETGSKITGNTNYVYSSDYAYVYGSGLYIYGGTFTMNGGEISGNTAYAYSSASYAGVWGGGINGFGTITINGGKISGNIAKLFGSSSSFADGIGLNFSGTFTINGGEISDNIIDSAATSTRVEGGGVFLCYTDAAMNGGTINGNGKSTANSGAVSVNGGGIFFGYENDTFTMTGGTISGNTAYRGGGVYVSSGAFIKTGGTIDATNSVSSGQGKVAYVYNYPNADRIRNTAAGPSVNLDSRESGSAGGWE